MSWGFSNKPLAERKYRCQVCKEELQYNMRYCNGCRENRKTDIAKHEKKLEENRKYKKGDVITSFEQFDKCDFVYWNNVIRHREFIKSFQYRVVCDYIKNGRLFEAIRKGELDEG